MEHLRHNLIYLYVALFLLNGNILSAMKRATPEQIRKAAEDAEAENILDEPAQNYQRIRGLLIIRGKKPAESLIEEFKIQLSDAQSSGQKAALHYLLAECYRADAIKKARSNHDGAALQNLHVTALPHLLAAFEQLPQGNAGNQLRRDIIFAVNRLLKDGDMDKLPTEMRRQVIEHYIRSPLDPLSALGVERTVAVYRDLGLEEELLQKYSGSPATESYEKLLDTMQYVKKLKSSQAAFPFAEALWTRFKQKLSGTPPDLKKVMEVYGNVAPKQTLVLFSDTVGRWPQLYLQLYAASKQCREFDAKEKYWQAYLMPYLQCLTEEKDAKTDPVAKYHSVAQELARQNDLEAALFVIQRAEQLTNAERSSTYGFLLLKKAECLEKLGKLEEARETYTKCSRAKNVASYLRENAENKLRMLDTRN